MKRRTLGYILVLGSVWGLAECGLGVALNACAVSISGSVMTAAALFFIAAAWTLPGRKAAQVGLLVAVAVAFKMFDVLWLGLPIGSPAVVHPAFAFVLEGGALVGLGAIFAQSRKFSPRAGALIGGASALIAAAAFPLVKLVSGTPACVVPGSSVPLAWAYAPLAAGLAMLSVPLGLRMGGNSLGAAWQKPWQVPAAVALCLALVSLIRMI